MTLGAILSIINDNSNVIVYRNYYVEVARYDRKNSIPEELNSENVRQIFAGDNFIGIDID